eukprot:UN05283
MISKFGYIFYISMTADKSLKICLFQDVFFPMKAEILLSEILVSDTRESILL